MPVRYAERLRGGHWEVADATALLLKACLRPPGEGIEYWRRWIATGPSLQTGHQGLLGLAYYRLHGIADGEPGLDVARAAFLSVWQRHQQRRRSLRRVLRRFQDAGIPVILLKGFALAVRYYGSPGARDMGDIDVWVPVADAPRARDLLLRSGWSLNPLHEGVPVASDLRVRHGWSLRRDRIQMDLHWTPFPECRSPLLRNSIRARAQPLEIDGQQAATLDPSDQLAHVLVHAVSLHSSPRWVADACTIMALPIDWDRIGQIAREADVRLRVAVALAYLRDVVGAPVPGGIEMRLDVDTATSWEWRELEVLRSAAIPGLRRALTWHLCHFRRCRPHDVTWKRLPTPLAFLDYLRVRSGGRLVDRAIGVVLKRTPSSRITWEDEPSG
jgi:hypothetical protein